jgi:hypothetical protein
MQEIFLFNGGGGFVGSHLAHHQDLKGKNVRITKTEPNYSCQENPIKQESVTQISKKQSNDKIYADFNTRKLSKDNSGAIEKNADKQSQAIISNHPRENHQALISKKLELS